MSAAVQEEGAVAPTDQEEPPFEQWHPGLPTLVSFDIFDTLLCRLVDSPDDVFDLMEREHPETTGRGFRRRRRAAEVAARAAGANEDIGIADIYSWIAREEGLSEAAAVDILELELRTELRVCVARADAVELLAGLRRPGRRVIGISDMYLGRDFVTALLEKAGIALDAVYVSGEEGVAKWTGNLFARVRELEEADYTRWRHYGDNRHSDVDVPLSLGMDAVHLPVAASPNRKADPRSESLANSVARGVERAVHYAAARDGTRSAVWSALGSRHTSVLAMALCVEARRVAEKHRASHIFFLARDGYALGETYETMYPDDRRKLVYLAASRRMVGFAQTCHVRPDMEFLTGSWGGLTARQLLGRVGVDIEHVDIEGCDRVLASEREAVDAIDTFSDLVVEQAAKERVHVLDYMRSQGLFSAADAVVVDVGWHCSLQKWMRAMISDAGSACRLHGVYIGTTLKSAPGMDVTGVVYEHRLPKAHFRTVHKAVEVMELLFTAPESSVVTVTPKTEGDGFDVVRVSNDEEQPAICAARDIGQGARAAVGYIIGAGLEDVVTGQDAVDDAVKDFDGLVENPSRQLVDCAAAIRHSIGFGGIHYMPLVRLGLTWRDPKTLVLAYHRAYWKGAMYAHAGRKERLLMSAPAQFAFKYATRFLKVSGRLLNIAR